MNPGRKELTIPSFFFFRMTKLGSDKLNYFLNIIEKVCERTGGLSTEPLYLKQESFTNRQLVEMT